MGTCTAPLEVADPLGRHYERVDALVGSGAAYTADQRASRQAVADVLLQEQEDQDVRQHLDEGRQAVAQSAAGGTSPSSSGSDSPAGGELHGHGRRASGRGVDSGATRPPHSAWCYIETTAGILSYRELESLLDLHQGVWGDLPPLVFWEEDALPQLGGLTLAMFSLDIDPVKGRLMPVDALMLTALERSGLLDRGDRCPSGVTRYENRH